jgi:hypothetical protein
MALRGYLQSAGGGADRAGGAQTACRRRTAESLLDAAAEAERVVVAMRTNPVRGQAAVLARHVTATGVKGLSAMARLRGYDALTTKTVDYFHNVILDIHAPFYRLLYPKPEERKDATAARLALALPADAAKLASAMLQPGFIKWPPGRGRPAADTVRRGGTRTIVGENWEKHSTVFGYLFDGLVPEELRWPLTCLRTSLTLQLIPGLRWRGQAHSENHDLAFVRALERLNIDPTIYNPFTGVMHEEVAHSHEYTLRFGQRVECWGKVVEQAMQDCKKFVPRGATGAAGLSTLIVNGYSSWLADRTAPRVQMRTLTDYAVAAKARRRPGRTARKRRLRVRDTPDAFGSPMFLMCGTPALTTDLHRRRPLLTDRRVAHAVMELLQRHPGRTTGYDHSGSLDSNLDAFLASDDATSAVEFTGARVGGISFHSEQRRLRGGAAGPTAGYTIAVLRRHSGLTDDSDGTITDEANCEFSETRQCMAQPGQSPPARVCLDIGAVKRLLRLSFRGTTVRVMQVQWYPPAAHEERVREADVDASGLDLDGADSGKPEGKRKVPEKPAEMYRRVRVLPPYRPLEGSEGNGEALLSLPRKPQRSGDGSFTVWVSAQHGRLPVVDTDGPLNQDARGWCFLDSFYDHAVLVRYPTGILGGPYFGQTDLGKLATKLFGSHTPTWRIVLPSSPDMALRMGLLGRRTSAIPYDTVVGLCDTYAGSSWRGGHVQNLDAVLGDEGSMSTGSGGDSASNSSSWEQTSTD